MRYAAVCRTGIDTPLRSRTLRDVALEDAGDRARSATPPRPPRSMRRGQTHYLDTLFRSPAPGGAPAAELVEDYRNRWGGRLEPLSVEQAY